MKIVVDTNTLPAVFNPHDSNHEDFKPVFDWIDSGRGKMVYGGTKYKTELGRMPRYLKLINLYKDAGIVIPINDENVNFKEIEILRIVPLGIFNDHHLVAIVIVSRCTLICTKDIRAMPFLRDRRFYPKGCSRPSLYTRKGNIGLLKGNERRN